MPNFKIKFTNNTVVTCDVTRMQLPVELEGNVYYHHNSATKQLVFAIINAKTDTEALQDAETLIAEYENK